MKITSEQFQHNGRIPSKYTCIGEDINPPLQISDVPEKTLSLALIVDDPDAPKGIWVHWVVYDMPPTVSKIKENSIPGIQGINDFKKNAYGGPCPPSGTHRYYFKIYALDKKLNLGIGKTKAEIEGAIQGHVLAQDELMGLFSKEEK